MGKFSSRKKGINEKNPCNAKDFIVYSLMLWHWERWCERLPQKRDNFHWAMSSSRNGATRSLYHIEGIAFLMHLCIIRYTRMSVQSPLVVLN